MSKTAQKMPTLAERQAMRQTWQKTLQNAREAYSKGKITPARMRAIIQHINQLEREYDSPESYL